MAASVSREELMNSHDHVVWDLNGTGFQDEDLGKDSSQTLWEFLNSKIANLLIVLLTVIECILLLATLLIDLNIIQDPRWPRTCNESASTMVANDNTSSFLRSMRNILQFIILIIPTIFLTEVLLKALSGRLLYLKSCVQLFDALSVLVAFVLGLTFLSAPKDGRVAAIFFVVLLRLWRIKCVSQCIKQDAKRQMTHLLNAYKRDKIQAEHKVELLILKVEDLEHEIAYLKEKMKKTERDAGHRKKRCKDHQDYLQAHQMRHCQTDDLPMTQRPQPEGRTESPPIDQDAVNLHQFAENTVKCILRTASNELTNGDKWRKKMFSRSEDSGQASSSISSQFHPLEQKPSKRKQDGMSSEEELDELSEIERIRNVHFDPSKKQNNIPMTTL